MIEELLKNPRWSDAIKGSADEESKGDPSISSEATKSRRPLSAAEVVVDELPENPGYYRAQFFLRPHFQLEGLTVSLRLVSKLPSAKQEVNA